MLFVSFFLSQFGENLFFSKTLRYFGITQPEMFSDNRMEHAQIMMNTPFMDLVVRIVYILAVTLEKVVSLIWLSYKIFFV